MAIYAFIRLISETFITIVFSNCTEHVMLHLSLIRLLVKLVLSLFIYASVLGS